MDDRDNYLAIFMSIRGQLARLVSRIVPPKEIEDVVQETYVRLCQIEKKEHLREPRAYLYKTAKNLALDYAKRAESRLSMSLEEDEYNNLVGIDRAMDETFDAVAANEEFGLFCATVRDLPIQIRRVFVLNKVYGCSRKEIADTLGISVNTVRNYTAIGLQRCTGAMIEREEGKEKAVQSHLSLANGRKEYGNE